MMPSIHLHLILFHFSLATYKNKPNDIALKHAVSFPTSKKSPHANTGNISPTRERSTYSGQAVHTERAFAAHICTHAHVACVRIRVLSLDVLELA